MSPHHPQTILPSGATLALLACLAAAPALAGGEASKGPAPSQASIEEPIKKDCKTVCCFLKAKNARLKALLKRGDRAGALDLADRIRDEEARSVERLVWYFSQDRSKKAHAQALAKVLDEIKSLSPEQCLNRCVDGKFAVASHFEDPFKPLEGEEDSGKDKDGGKDSDKGSSSPPATVNYGVSTSGGAAPSAAVAKPAPAAPKPPPAPRPGGGTPGGGAGTGGGGAGSGGGSGAGSDHSHH
jgi:hypothetical protein